MKQRISISIPAEILQKVRDAAEQEISNCSIIFARAAKKYLEENENR